jgi:hypothetical protein
MGADEFLRPAAEIREAERTASKRLSLLLIAMAGAACTAVCGLMFALTLAVGPALLCALAASVTAGSATACVRVMER